MLTQNFERPHASLKAANLISDFNSILSASGVSSNNFLSSAGVEMVNSTFPGMCKDDILEDMEDATGSFSNIDFELIEKGADIAFTILNGPSGPSSCFAGYSGHVGGQAILWESNNPFAVTADNYLTASADYTGVHEIGHIFNGNHPNYVYTSNRGIINTSDNTPPIKYWQSVMGGYEPISSGDCNFVGPNDTLCERVGYFSNPALTYNGDPLGSGTHDMESHLEYAMPIASNWRGSPVPKPGTPTGFMVSAPECYGHYQVEWDTMSGATSYQLYKSIFSNFASSSQVYSGTSTSTWINIPSGTWYLRAKACNAAGCSSLSVQKSATRVAYCM